MKELERTWNSSSEIVKKLLGSAKPYMLMNFEV